MGISTEASVLKIIQENLKGLAAYFKQARPMLEDAEKALPKLKIGSASKWGLKMSEKTAAEEVKPAISILHKIRKLTQQAEGIVENADKIKDPKKLVTAMDKVDHLIDSLAETSEPFTQATRGLRNTYTGSPEVLRKVESLTYPTNISGSRMQTSRVKTWAAEIAKKNEELPVRGK